MQTGDVMAVFRETGALQAGHFELRSGLHSDEYFQCALVLQHPDLAERLCGELAARIKAGCGPGLDPGAVIAPALGGIPVGHEVARALGVRSIFAEKQEGGLVLRRGFRIGKGERFVVAEDVMTRGGRIQQTVDIVTAHGGVVVAIGVLVDRSGGKAQFDRPTFSLLQIEPKTWEPADCPLCENGAALDHPGS